MAIDTKHNDLLGLRIDRNQRFNTAGARSAWTRRYVVIGITVVILLSLSSLAYRARSASVSEVEVAYATAESSSTDNTVLSATGYIIAHHTINVNSKVTGRLAWIGVEKGDKVSEGQVLVCLEDQEFRASYEQAKGALQNARAYLEELEDGSRPQEIQQAQHNLDEARAILANDKLSLDRTTELAGADVVSRQTLDDSRAKFEAEQQRVNSLESTLQLLKIGPRTEELARARGALIQAEGQLEYAKSQLDATVIRAPVTGTILDRTAEKGELITAQFASSAAGGPQGSVVSLADLSDLQVELDIAQADFARLGPRQRGIITVDAFPDRKYNGEITEISPEANRQKATVQVKVQVLSPDEYLRPEMNATVKFLANEAPKSLNQPFGVFVPSTGIRDRDNKKIVFLAHNGKALVREVHIVKQRTNGVVVAGLAGGEVIITSAPSTLKNGDKITIKGNHEYNN